ncbi:guanine-1-methyltransferase-domain-containing protein [Gamsiella multidivaricata]|uniref:guanine-1-methyltransferase-domain-containing protein n=1 Tax=Gamsiella multidivaricata TaxID=101098 RepID=UPI00222127F3|nr:guanine-1-methyltransferase-domain-containing protein [Gamsiella multidivaricata]KAI7819907.1 guanine-1-methyltransferase-domain-containing protein [Gamsiella multidivaricata]
MEVTGQKTLQDQVSTEDASALAPTSPPTEPSPANNSTREGEAQSATPEDTAASAQAQNPNSQNNPFWKPRAPPMIGPDGKPLSRNATKKLLKQQQFLERKPMLRVQEKLKRKQKDKERREAIEAGLIEPPPKRHKTDQIQTGITIGIDMSFDDLMLEKEVKSMVDQIKRCYSYNRTCEKIVHLALTSFTGKSKQEFNKRANGYELWKNFTIHEKSLEEVWPSEEISGKQHLEELKRLTVIASAKSEAVKAKALAAKTEAAGDKGAPKEEASSFPAHDPQAPTDITTPSSNEQPYQTESSSPVVAVQTPPPSGGSTLSALDIKALEQERLLKEEQLAMIPAVKKVVYLSADSPNTITKLEEGTCYILGGIVDKNRYPNLCQNKAEKLGIATAQLPIGEYIQMSSRRILTVNQVFEILLQFIECNDWKEAFLKVIPQRKLEEKPRVRRSTDAWRGNPTLRGAAGSSAERSVSSSVASSVSGNESDHNEENNAEKGQDGVGSGDQDYSSAP